MHSLTLSSLSHEVHHPALSCSVSLPAHLSLAVFHNIIFGIKGANLDSNEEKAEKRGREREREREREAERERQKMRENKRLEREDEKMQRC